MCKTKTMRKDLPVIPVPTSHLCSQVAEATFSILSSEPDTEGGERTDMDPGRWGLVEIKTQCPLSIVPSSTSQQRHLLLQLDQTLGLRTSISSPFSWLPLLSHGADMTPIRIAEVALTKQFMSLSAIDSAALGGTAAPRSSSPHGGREKAKTKEPPDCLRSHPSQDLLWIENHFPNLYQLPGSLPQINKSSSEFQLAKIFTVHNLIEPSPG